MKKLCLLLALSVFVSFALPHTHARADEHELEYDTSGKVKVDKEIENTYNIPKISAGFIFENTELTSKPIMSVKIFNEETICLDGYDCKVSFTFGEQYAGLATHVVLADIYEVSVGPSFGYNIKEKEPSVGISFLAVEF